MDDQALSQSIKRLGLLPVVYAVKPVLALLNYNSFQQLKAVTAGLALGPLLKRQPRFLYKYMVPYAAANFKRSTRLTVLINHYQYIVERASTDFFPAMAHSPVIWRKSFGSDECTIALSYPLHVSNEAELSLHLTWNSMLTQVVSFVIAPGSVVGATSLQVLLISQVQGFANAAQLKDITKTLDDITPATLLVHAAYGLATALRIDIAAGVSRENKVGKWLHRHFNYDAFWLDLKGALNEKGDLFLLPIPPPEKPIAEIKRNHRARTLRKRLFKENVRQEVAQFWQLNFGLKHPDRAEPSIKPGERQSDELELVSTC